VRIWAESHGYFFQNLGREGHDGMIGAAPTDAKFEPVTTVSWRDVIVWLNALSEMSGLTPVYRDHALGAMIVRDSRDANASVVDGVITWNYNGYRLPTSDRWEMAARWTNDTKLSDENVKVDERYWAKGGFASGATGHTQEEKRVVAWYDGAEGGNFTRPVAQLMPNKLGVYDMSGNVYEWVYEWRLNHQGSYRTVRGGSYTSLTSYITVAYVSFAPQDSAESYYGFRILRKP
jgi:formylglycine-generating enzyme